MSMLAAGWMLGLDIEPSLEERSLDSFKPRPDFLGAIRRRDVLASSPDEKSEYNSLLAFIIAMLGYPSIVLASRISWFFL
jgi:hypothetical protein